MATIKGQNLRIVNYEDGECIAMATSCQLHVSVEMSDISSKDDDDGWARVYPSGINWEITADALVSDGTNAYYEEVDSFEPAPGSGHFDYYYPQPIVLRKGDNASADAGAKKGGFGFCTADGTPVKEATSTQNKIVYTATDDITVYFYTNDDTMTVTIRSTDLGLNQNDFVEWIRDGANRSEQYEIHLTTGVRNREDDPWNSDNEAVLVYGQVKPSDISITANNRQPSTYTLRLTGTGQLHIEHA